MFDGIGCNAVMALWDSSTDNFFFCWSSLLTPDDFVTAIKHTANNEMSCEV